MKKLHSIFLTQSGRQTNQGFINFPALAFINTADCFILRFCKLIIIRARKKRGTKSTSDRLEKTLARLVYFLRWICVRSGKKLFFIFSRTPAIDGVLDSSYLGNQTEVNKLKELIRQRDNEINILYHRFEKRYWYNRWLCCGCMNWLTRGPYVLLGS